MFICINNEKNKQKYYINTDYIVSIHDLNEENNCIITMNNGVRIEAQASVQDILDLIAGHIT